VCRIGGSILKSFDGIYVKEDTWTGEDIFYPVGLPGTVIVSEKFFNLVQDENITNINLAEARGYSSYWSR
jgi:hypothetical protein